MSRYHHTNEATMVKMLSKSNKSFELEKFLKSGGALVKQTEPKTKVWFALKEKEQSFMIFDAFYDSTGREAHFAGQVAAALKNNAAELVQGGWKGGILQNITNSKVLSSKIPETTIPVSIASYIVFQSREGQSEQLAALLAKAAEMVDRTEPKTVYWFALQINQNTFAIFDAFADESGRNDHFSGMVAAILKDNSEAMIKNGWEKGVVSNIHNLEVITNI
ncbi:hypothetical protein [Legionella israelensis]|uniref:hypothetical protein n=1 Tax=Legionella israelensis TaxID=454 RepID=UPI0031455987